MGWYTRFRLWAKGIDSKKLNNDVAKVQALTTKACSFVPTASSVAAMLTAGNPTVVGVAAIATTICQVLARLPQATLQASLWGDSIGIETPSVNGITVEGTFVAPSETK